MIQFKITFENIVLLIQFYHLTINRKEIEITYDQDDFVHLYIDIVYFV